MSWNKRIFALGLLGSLAVYGQASDGPPKKPATATPKKSTNMTTAHKAPAKPAPGTATGHVAPKSTPEPKRRNAAVGHKASPAAVVSRPTAETLRLTRAFTESAQLRPMAQQLISTRSLAAYNGVLAYAAGHPGEAAAAAQLSLGHAYMLDHRFGDAATAFQRANQSGQSLADYAEYLGAQAAVAAARPTDAYPLLNHFAERNPGSLFASSAPVLLANAYLEAKNPGAAIGVLSPLQAGPEGTHTDFRFALAKAYQASGDTQHAAELYRGIYINDPLSAEADGAKKQLAALSVPLTAGERKSHADAMFNAKHFDIAQQEYRALEKDETGLTDADRDALKIYAAVCDLRLKKLSSGDVSHLPVTGDDSAALKMYLEAELARNQGKTDDHDKYVQQMLTQYAHSRWLEESLYSGGNMYLLKRDQPHAVEEYTQLFTMFPHSVYAPNAHWHAAWLSYRMRKYPDAARLMDEQIMNYPAGTEVAGALYWRGRLYEDIEHNFSQAINYYRALNVAYVNTYYAILGRQRLAVLGTHEAVAPAPALAYVRPVPDPGLTATLPENDPHLIKARLLANAGLNEYIRPEIQMSATSGQWGVLAEAEIYQSFGEDTRALQTMKHSGLPFFSLPVANVPNVYWQMVFPRPYWDQISGDAAGQGLDPYLVASLIRQESEFNPTVVSKANAYGLMQLLPSTGRGLAKQIGDNHFSTAELLSPTTNLQLGTIDLKRSIEKYNGQVEYALAAYNAGDGPVRTWLAAGDYKDVAEWVESIPYTETREYVQSIMRNREMYRAVYAGR